MKDTTFDFFEEATKQVSLKLTGRSANFFKREGLFNKPLLPIYIRREQWRYRDDYDL